MNPANASPAVSIVIPCYNLGAYLDEGLRSIEQAGYNNLDVIIVDDGSTDPETQAALTRIESNPGAASRFPLRVLHQSNQGVSTARNAGIAASTASYIVPLDADDRVGGNFIAQAVEGLESEPELGVIYGDIRRFGDEEALWELPEFDPVQLLVNNFIPATVLMRRQAWADCKGYDPEVTSHEDWELWIHMMGRGWGFRHLPVVAVEYRARADSKVKMWDRPEIRRELVGHVCHKHVDLFKTHLAEVITRKEIEKCELSNLVRSHMEFVKTADTQIKEHAESLQVRIDFIQKLTEAFRELEGQRDALLRDLAARDRELQTIHGTRWWRIASWVARMQGRRTPAPAQDRSTSQ